MTIANFNETFLKYENHAELTLMLGKIFFIMSRLLGRDVIKKFGKAAGIANPKNY